MTTPLPMIKRICESVIFVFTKGLRKFLSEAPMPQILFLVRTASRLTGIVNLHLAIGIFGLTVRILIVRILIIGILVVGILVVRILIIGILVVRILIVGILVVGILAIAILVVEHFHHSFLGVIVCVF